jgi:hypothetical protein
MLGDRVKGKPKERWWKKDIWVWGTRFFAIMGICSLLTFVVVAGVDQNGHPTFTNVWEAVGESRDSWLVLLSGALAVATYGLFKRTSDLAEETKAVVLGAKDQMEQAERHHQQGLSGIVILEVEQVQIVAPAIIRKDPSKPTSWNTTVSVTAKIVNVGNGPAFGVELTGLIAGKPFDEKMLVGTIRAGKTSKTEINLNLNLETVGENKPTLEFLADLIVRVTWRTSFESEGRTDYEYQGNAIDGTFDETEVFFKEKVFIPGLMPFRRDMPKSTSGTVTPP